MVQGGRFRKPTRESPGLEEALGKTLQNGTALSIIAALVLTFGVQLVGGTDDAVSLSLGLITFLVGLLLTAFQALADRLDEIDRARTELQPFRELHSVPQLVGPIGEIITAVASTQDSRSEFVLNRTTEAVRDFSAEIKRMADGVFVCKSESEELALVKQALAETERTVRAIAARGPEWWLREDRYAQTYFRAYERAAERLDVTRIFILDRGDLERMRPVLEQQRRANIKTYALDAAVVPQALVQPLVLFDDRLLHTVQPGDGDEPGAHRVVFSDVKQELDDAERIFNALLDLVEDEHACLFSPPMNDRPGVGFRWPWRRRRRARRSP